VVEVVVAGVAGLVVLHLLGLPFLSVGKRPEFFTNMLDCVRLLLHDYFTHKYSLNSVSGCYDDHFTHIHSNSASSCYDDSIIQGDPKRFVPIFYLIKNLFF
jgi:hypothetical protein